MKTKERILLTALTLFNEHGEGAVTSVDIAMELDISPGNLYYHFKGKEVMVEALAKMHIEQMTPLLNPAVVAEFSDSDCFYYLFMLIQKQQVFRFLYRNPTELGERYPHAATTMQKLMRSMEKQLKLILTDANTKGLCSIEQEQITMLVTLMMVLMTQTNQYDQFRHHWDEEAASYQTLSLLLVALLPRFHLSPAGLEQLNAAVTDHTLANTPHQNMT